MRPRSFVRSFVRPHVKIIFGGYRQLYTNARETERRGGEKERPKEKEAETREALSDRPWISLHGSLSKAPAMRSSCHGHSRRLSFTVLVVQGREFPRGNPEGAFGPDWFRTNRNFSHVVLFIKTRFIKFRSFSDFSMNNALNKLTVN